MAKDKESPLMQDLGPKKYQTMLEKNSSFYDKYKAGKRDPKTGEFYHHIGLDKPKGRTKTGKDMGDIECPKCGRLLNIRSSTIAISCSQCRTNIVLEYDKELEEMRIKEIRS
jgi:hypothetical protein